MKKIHQKTQNIIMICIIFLQLCALWWLYSIGNIDGALARSSLFFRQYDTAIFFYHRALDKAPDTPRYLKGLEKAQKYENLQKTKNY
jgi:hypothetical protein